MPAANPNLGIAPIDRLAAEGPEFTHFRTGTSICSPSRAAFPTGAYSQRAGLDMDINPKRTTAAVPKTQRKSKFKAKAKP